MYQDFSRIYEGKIGEDFDYPQMADFVRTQAAGAGIPMRRMLDLGCGTGNAGAQLTRDFDELVLCDPSAEMLALAREKFQPPFRPLFLEGDAAGFTMPGRFDLILSVLDIPNYLKGEELRAFLINSWTNLGDNGLLIFDFSTEHKLREMARTGTYIYDEADCFYVWENHLAGNALQLEITFFIPAINHQGTPLYQRVSEEQTMYIITKDEIEQQAQAIGFAVLGSYNGYSPEPVREDSLRVVFVLKKETHNNG